MQRAAPLRPLYVYGLAQPRSSRGVFALLPKADAAHRGRALTEFVAWADPESRKRLVVLVNDSGAHRAKRLAVPANVTLHYLPAFMPELQPAERLWPLVREAANRWFADLLSLTDTLAARCR